MWVIELQAGRPNAAEPIFKKVIDAVETRTASAFRKFARVGRFADLNDVIQGAMARLLSAMKAIRPESTRHFYALVNTAIRRELLDLIKKYYGPAGAGRHLVDAPVGDRSATDPADPTVDADAELEKMTAFHLAVEELPVEPREAYSLRYYHGWQQDAIADLLQVSVRTVNRWQREAEKTLRAKIGHLA
jgi:RNA polymerase sigma-70 factor (ECF subfamily)